MRVCIVLHTDLFHPWPVVRPWREAQLLQKVGREVSVLSWIKDESTPWPIREMRDGIAVRRVKFAPPRGGLTRAISYRRISRMFASEIAALRPDAILCHDLEMLWASVIAGRSLDVPVLYHAHEDWPAMVSERSRVEGIVFEGLERRLVRRVDHVYAASEERAERYRRWRVPVTVVYGSKSLAEIPQLSPSERAGLRSAAGFAPDDFVVGIAGSLGRNEALPSVLEALAPLPSTVKLYIVGGVPEKVDAAKELVDRKGLTDRTVFTGRLPTPEYLRQVGLLDVGLALFHRTSENLWTVIPLKLLDYLALGVPAVVSDFPAMRRVVDRFHFGIPVPAQDAGAIREAVRILREDPGRRQEMARQAALSFSDHFSWERQEEKLARSHAIFRPS